MSLTSPHRMSTTTEILPALEEIYAQIKRINRELRPSDHIVGDLAVDSLATLEILLGLERRFGVALVDNPREAKIETVGDLVGLIEDLRAESAGYVRLYLQVPQSRC